MIYREAMNTFLNVFNALPAVIGAVQAVEVAIPVPQSGQQKLNLLLGAAAAAWEVSQVEQALSKSTTLNAITALTNLTVASLNAAGVFNQSVPVSSK
jgi:hypothetical protein